MAILGIRQGGKISKFIQPAVSKLAAPFASPVISRMISNTATTATTGFAFGTVSAIAEGKSIGGVLHGGLTGAEQGAIMGAVIGGVQGYKYAKENNLDLWTGRSTLPPIKETPLSVPAITNTETQDGSDIIAAQTNKSGIYQTDIDGNYERAQEEWDRIRTAYGRDITQQGGPSGFNVKLPGDQGQLNFFFF